MKNMKLVLVFKDDVVVSMETVTVENEKVLEELLGDMVVSKCRVWCG